MAEIELTGRRLDARIHEQVFGGCCRYVMHADGSDVRFDESGFDVPPRYSTDLAAAWLVVEKLGEVTVLRDPDARLLWICSVWNGHAWVRGAGDTAPLAICRAALRASFAPGGREGREGE